MYAEHWAEFTSLVRELLLAGAPPLAPRPDSSDDDDGDDDGEVDGVDVEVIQVDAATTEAAAFSGAGTSAAAAAAGPDADDGAEARSVSPHALLCHSRVLAMIARFARVGGAMRGSVGAPTATTKGVPSLGESLAECAELATRGWDEAAPAGAAAPADASPFNDNTAAVGLAVMADKAGMRAAGAALARLAGRRGRDMSPDTARDTAVAFALKAMEPPPSGGGHQGYAVAALERWLDGLLRGDAVAEPDAAALAPEACAACIASERGLVELHDETVRRTPNRKHRIRRAKTVLVRLKQRSHAVKAWMRSGGAGTAPFEALVSLAEATFAQQAPLLAAGGAGGAPAAIAPAEAAQLEGEVEAPAGRQSSERS